MQLNFTELRAGSEWNPVNDGVMGGLSRSRLLPDSDGTVRFEGEVSLENNGGFASVRHRLRQPPPENSHLLRLQVLGDGKVYKLSLRIDDSFDSISYQADFYPASHQWMEIDFTPDQFVPTFRGRVVNAPAMTSFGQVHQLGLMIANRQSGAFCLKLRSISFL